MSEELLLVHIEYVVNVVHLAELVLAVLTFCSLFHCHPIIQITTVLLIVIDLVA